ncbi:DUF1285 domain-containing protein [Shewanella litorisediminis]|uniref:DUF1285 domain-containing protein n=1 Tax=Shewanella litorisediminis TaxID=1173586 RepID=A0ABX7FZ87_9GAMM|nr:DUF1285 domain-containing protein [Shewanella litorisediminis]MCL2918672.1 DUF1285 domain-containing protein [Shewanella litorisediminis]QRH00353.1 DUF1285 domain-containing protein [Shewanella litorisediminis]
MKQVPGHQLLSAESNPQGGAADTDAFAAMEKLALPPLCSEQPLFDIDEGGRWYYQGEPLPDKFARLFMGILRPYDGGWALVTPVERVKVAVARTPVVIVDFEPRADRLLLTCVLGIEYWVARTDIAPMEEGVFISLPELKTGSMSRACFYRYAELLLCGKD